MPATVRSKFGAATLGIVMLGSVSAAANEETNLPEPATPQSGMILLAPLVGFDRNELTFQAGPPGTPPVTTADTDWEYGFYSMYVSPRFVLNNVLFFAHANDADIWGDVAYANVYGDPQSAVTWNLGGGYLWHRISTDQMDIRITQPMVKVGALLRWPQMHATLNPFVGYAWQTISMPQGDENTKSVLYGVAADWRWRMFYATAKYYLEDNRNNGRQYNVLRVVGSLNLSRSTALMGRIEYMEHSTGTDTSVLLGPAFVF